MDKVNSKYNKLRATRFVKSIAKLVRVVREQYNQSNVQTLNGYESTFNRNDNL